MEGIGCKLAWALELERVDSQHPFCLLLIRLTKSHLGHLGGSTRVLTFYWASHVQLAAGGFVRGVCSCAGPQRQSRASPPGGAKTGTRRISRVRPGHN